MAMDKTKTGVAADLERQKDAQTGDLDTQRAAQTGSDTSSPIDAVTAPTSAPDTAPEGEAAQATPTPSATQAAQAELADQAERTGERTTDPQEAVNLATAVTQANRVARDPEPGSDAVPPGVAIHGEANPAPATAADVEASGAIVEPSIKEAIDVAHESVDANPREGTSARQNAVDWNDANRRTPADRDFAGQGLDPTPYGAGPSTR